MLATLARGGARTGTALGTALATVAGAAALIWALQLLAPGDPARRVLAAQGITDPLPAQVAATRHELGLDRVRCQNSMQGL
jgi:ABC-type dipeptide/oligopeptide/nickel transport system permease component